MKERTPWGSRIFLRYLLYQLPGFGLWSLVFLIIQQLLVLPLWLVPAALSVLLAKNLILFPSIWMAYEAGSAAQHPPPGSLGVVVKTLSPEGYIRIEGELWRAETAKGERSISAGTTVTVDEIRGLILLVRPVSPDSQVPGGVS